jgi:(R,R)-butanediol dehydrogenase/meso-butanediol dehydrogenase/diacetyl reductase
MSDDEAALVEPSAVAVYACDRDGIRAGNSVLVTDAGPIGVLTLMAARAAGATQLFVTDPNDTRLDLVRRIIERVMTINPTKENPGEVIRAATEGGLGCDVAIKAVGNEWRGRSPVSAAAIMLMTVCEVFTFGPRLQA